MKNESTPDTHHDMDEFHKHNTEENKPDAGNAYEHSGLHLCKTGSRWTLEDRTFVTFGEKVEVIGKDLQ